MDNVRDSVVDGDHVRVALLQLLDEGGALGAGAHQLHGFAADLDGLLAGGICCAAKRVGHELEACSQRSLADGLPHLAGAAVDQDRGLLLHAGCVRSHRGPSAVRLLQLRARSAVHRSACTRSRKKHAGILS